MLPNNDEQPIFLSFLKQNKGPHYQSYWRPEEGLISFRTLDLPSDLDILYNWVHSEKAKRFWGLQLSKQGLEECYTAILQQPNTHSLIGLLDQAPVCQVDLYTAASDEIAPYIEDLQPSDMGLHFLMAPTDHPVSGLSHTMLYQFLRYYFSFPANTRIWGEPDAENVRAIRLIQHCGFRPLKTIQLPYKAALLHCLTKEECKQPK